MAVPALPGLVRGFGIVALFLAAALFGTASGVLFAFVGDLPQITALDDYKPGTITRVLARDGAVVGEYAAERRQVITYDQISPHLRNAILAAEDADFMHHSGLSLPRLAVTLVRDIVNRELAGASTLTQQLARNLFPTTVGFERRGLAALERKIKEALVAIQIEKRYTKEEIFTMYCNQIYFGHLTYGVESASQLYFGKSARDLSVGEAAMIAGIIQGNRRQSPYENMNAAIRRRNYALDRMATEGMITVEEAEAVKAQPIVTRGTPSGPPSIAPHFLEAVRTYLEDEYGAKEVLESGLTVKTGLDVGLQRAAVIALDRGLRRIDKLRGYRKPARSLVAEKRPLDGYRHPRWVRDPVEGEIVPAVVMGTEGGVIRVRVGKWFGTIDAKGYAWTRRRAIADVAATGDLVEVQILKLDPKGTFTALLEQPPAVEGALLAIDNHTGEIRAMVGGNSFERSQFNRSMQAMRQVGSLFKPFVYVAAIDTGYTAASEIEDAPVSFYAGPGQPPYEPKNYDREYHGFITLRQALEGSRNVPTIRLMDKLGPPQVIKYARQLGITAPLPPYLSTAIGAAESTLLEMTSAYSAFPNQGVRMKPSLLLEVTDREGNVLEQTRPQPSEAIRADTAYIVTSLLTGVVQNGTATTARTLNWPVGGKTGTTDDYTDAWFIGFDPDITIGVWIGFDQKRTIGNNQTGTVAALPVWIETMKTWVDRRRKELEAPPEFARPTNVTTALTDRGPEVFIVGTQPNR
jgi:penicillin-binding protein 1A